jgi:2-C-methyl-D-erythritol 4-phosphate cytidylyltransferase
LIAAIIVAAGSGERLGAGRPKALVALAGRRMLDWSLVALGETDRIDQIVVVMPAGSELMPDGVQASFNGREITAVTGGPSRSHSVRAGLAACDGAHRVLVHDAARPLITPALADAVLDRLADDELADGAIAAARVTDTIKRADGAGAVTATLPREELWAVQTPQVFRASMLRAALDVDDATLAAATDDAALIERAGGRIVIAPWAEPNPKITSPADLAAAEAALATRPR